MKIRNKNKKYGKALAVTSNKKLLYYFFSINNIFALYVIFIAAGCKQKPVDNNFPEFEFRYNLELLGEIENFGDFSLNLPKNYDQIDSIRFHQIKVGLENDKNSFFNIELIKGFSKEGNSAILVSRIQESNFYLKLDDAYIDYLSLIPETTDIEKTSFKLNGINTVQYQINGKTITNIKLFLFIDENIFCLDYSIKNSLFNDKVAELESCLSTLKTNTETIK